MNNRVEAVGWILLKLLKVLKKLPIRRKYWIVIYLSVTSQGLYTYHHGFTPHTSFTACLEGKNCGYQRKHNQWQNTFLERRDILIPTTHYNGFTPRTSFAMQKTADKGTILNGCCLFLLAIFLPKRKLTAANHYRSSYNNQLWRSTKSSTDHITYAHAHMRKL